MPQIASILDKPSSEIERPKPLPQGTYTCVVKGMPTLGKSSKKQTEFVEFLLQPLAAHDDVDQEALEAMGGFTDKVVKATYYHTNADGTSTNNAHQLPEFLDHCGAGDESMTPRARLELAAGCQVNAFIKHEPSMNGGWINAKVGHTAPVE